MFFSNYSDAMKVAKEKAQSESKTFKVIKNDNGWSLTLNNNEPINSFNTRLNNSTAPMDTPVGKTPSYSSIPFIPTPKPELEGNKIKNNKSSTPPEGAYLNSAIDLLQWVCKGLDELSSMRYREGTTNTVYAQKMAKNLFSNPLLSLSGSIGERKVEKYIGIASRNLDFIYLKKRNGSVSNELKRMHGLLEESLEVMRDMLDKGVKTHRGIRYTRSAYKDDLILYEWKINSDTNSYELMYVGRK